MAEPSNEDEISEDYADQSFETESPVKGPGVYTFVLEVDGKVSGEVALSAGSFQGAEKWIEEDAPSEMTAQMTAHWERFLKAVQAVLKRDVEYVEYDDKFGPDKADNIKCGSADEWGDLAVMMVEDEKYIKGRLTIRVFCKGQQAKSAGSAVVSAGSAISESIVRKLLLAKDKILKGCASMDKSGVGLVTTAELAKQLQENAGCSAADADALVSSGGAWREIVPNGRGQMIDYKMFCLRVRLLDKEELTLVNGLSNPDLQAARMAILARPGEFKNVLSGCQGQVSPKQCAQLLKEQGHHLMGSKHATALCSYPGSLAAQKDMRSLADDLELVDTVRLHRSPLIDNIILGCVHDFASSNGSKSKEALAASADQSRVLPSSKFCEVFEKMDPESFCSAYSLLEAPEPPHTVSRAILNPLLTAATGALRHDLEVDFNNFTRDLSIAHESEIHLLNAGRRQSLQEARRKILKKRVGVEKELVEHSNTVEKLKEILTSKSSGFESQEAEELCADVPKDAAGKQDALEHIKRLQFSDVLGTLDECAEALFAKYDDLISSCETKEPNDKEGSIGLGEFVDAMELAAVDTEQAKKFRQVLANEGEELVAWRELLQGRMRVLSWRELEILKLLRDETEQAARLKLHAAAARVFVALSDDAEDDDLVASDTVKAKLISVGSLSEAEADRIVKVLQLSPLANGNKINTTDILGFRTYIASRDCDSEAMKGLMNNRKGFLDACYGSGGESAPVPVPQTTGPDVDLTAVRSAMHRVHLAAWSVDALMGIAERAHADLSKVHVGSMLSRMAVVTSSERRRLEMLADSRLQLARLALIKIKPSGDKGPKERLQSLVSGLTKKVGEAKLVKETSPLQGSMTSEDLVDSLSATICDFDPVVPFLSAAELADVDAGSSAAPAKRSGGKGAGGKTHGKAGDGMTPGQRIFYAKLIKPRKPGIREMLDVMRGMPASISASPLRERQRAGFNLPSAAVHSVMHASASNILTLTVTITGAEGEKLEHVTKKFKVLERRARVCLVHAKSKSFVSGAFTVPISNKNDKGDDSWVFSKKKENGNPFLVRAPMDAEYELYIELALLTQKKGTDTEGQEALNNGHIREFSAGFGSLRLHGDVKAGAHDLPLRGGTPWAPVQVEAAKRGGGIFSFGRKKGSSQVSISIQMEKSAELDQLPPAIVCHDRIKEGLAEFCKLQKTSIRSREMFVRPDINDVVLGTFPAIMDSQDVMILFAKRWDEYKKKAKKEEIGAAFRECVQLFYPLVHMDGAKLPKALDAGPGKRQEERRKVLEAYFDKAKNTDKLVEQLLSNDAFRGVPFRVSELVVS